MFIETTIAVFALGVIVGATWMYWRAAVPAMRENTILNRERARELRQRAYRREARKHYGTPYLPAELRESLSPVVDDHNGSRRVNLEAVQ